MSARRVRLDAVMVQRGLARSRAQARELIEAGSVSVSGGPASKASTLVAADQPVVVAEGRRWASRGGGKLDSALDELGVDVEGRFALDAGASTGGFTDVLLARGAQRVVAVDVGYGQLDWRLRNDERVVVLDRTNVRHLQSQDVPPPAPQVVVADLSFISLTLVLPALARVADPQGDFVLLVKPQFEARKEQVGRSGVVADPAVWEQALLRVAEAATAQGLGIAGATVSRVPGPAGNIEFFLHLQQGGSLSMNAAAARAVSLASDA